jgi:DNA-binding phage protein
MSIESQIVQVLNETANLSMLSRDSGVSLSTIFKAKAGTHQPSMHNTEKILDSLGYELKIVRKPI